jgi:hypothetical protein
MTLDLADFVLLPSPSALPRREAREQTLANRMER